MSLQVNLVKENEAPKKLALNLTKEEHFTVRLSWDEATFGEKTDIDLHAIVCTNTGAGAKASAMEDVLSTYNVRRMIRGQQVGTLEKMADGTFEVYGGALLHSPDATDGAKEGDDEWIKVSPSKLPPVASGVREIPLVAMIHPQASGKRFKDVRNATVEILDGSSKSLMKATLTNQFGNYSAVQMGTVMIHSNGSSEFVAVGTGFDGDFNTVLGYFS